MNSLQELEGPIDAEISQALVEATPEWWRQALLVVERDEHPGQVVGLVCTISSPEGFRDLVVATEEVILAVRKSSLLFERFGKPWRRGVWRLHDGGEAGWSYVVDFEY